MAHKLPDLLFEEKLWRKGFIVIGVDEVGRGAFAGPLVVGGVIFQPTKNNKRITRLLSYGINDSKKLKPNERKTLAKVIQNESLAYHLSKINAARINRIGIGKATFCAMRDVVKNLRENVRLSVLGHRLSVSSSPVFSSSVLRPEDRKPKDQIPKTENREQITERIFVLVDGFYVKYLKGIGLKNQRGIVNGDNVSLSIAAASIIAKVARDNHMKKLSAKYKAYGWGRNKGYGTNFHRAAIAKFGPTPLHRKVFIKNSLQGLALQS